MLNIRTIVLEGREQSHNDGPNAGYDGNIGLELGVRRP